MKLTTTFHRCAFALLLLLLGCKAKQDTTVPYPTNRKVANETNDGNETHIRTNITHGSIPTNSSDESVSTSQVTHIGGSCQLLTSSSFESNILLVAPDSRIRISKYVTPYVFPNSNSIHLTNVFERILAGAEEYGYSSTGGAFEVSICYLHYRALIDVVTNMLLSPTATNNLRLASLCVGPLRNVTHPDALRAFIDVDARLPMDSPLRQGTTPAWTRSIPLFTRDDCLDIYLEIAKHPEKHRFGRWYDAIETLPYFTNANAVAGMQQALAVVKDPAKYWPDMEPSLYIWSVEEKIKLQQEYVQKKRTMLRTDTIVFDE